MFAGAAVWRREASAERVRADAEPSTSTLQAQSPPLKKIATEEAFTIPELIAPMREVLQRGGPNLDLTLLRTIYADATVTPARPQVTGPSGANRDVLARQLLPQLLDIDTGRIADMDASGVDVHVLSLFMPGVQLLSRDTATTLARIANDRLPSGTITLSKGQTFQFSARGTFSDGSVQDPLPGVTWSSAPTAVASITTSGLATGVAAGIAQIVATRNGIQSDPTSFVVQPLPVALFGPIDAGSTVVEGAVAEAGASVRVFVNGLPRGPTTIANAAGEWSVAGLTPALVTGDPKRNLVG